MDSGREQRRRKLVANCNCEWKWRMFEDEERRQAVNCDHNDAHLVLDIRVSLLSTLPPIHTKVK